MLNDPKYINFTFRAYGDLLFKKKEKLDDTRYQKLKIEGQTIQWSKDNGQTTNYDLQQTTQQTEDRATQSPLKHRCEARCSEMVSRSCSTIPTHVWKCLIFFMETNLCIFCLLVVFILPMEISLSRKKERVNMTWIGLSLPHFCTCHKTETELPNVVFNNLM